MNSGAVVSWTVMVCVAERCFSIVCCSKGANDRVVARSIASVVRYASMVTSPQLSEAMASSIGISSSTHGVVCRDEGELGRRGVLDVMVCVAELLFQHRPLQ